jgi:hypothetical protein
MIIKFEHLPLMLHGPGTKQYVSKEVSHVVNLYNLFVFCFCFDERILGTLAHRGCLMMTSTKLFWIRLTVWRHMN